MDTFRRTPQFCCRSGSSYLRLLKTFFFGLSNVLDERARLVKVA
jgi:hypothetical protein